MTFIEQVKTELHEMSLIGEITSHHHTRALEVLDQLEGGETFHDSSTLSVAEGADLALSLSRNVP